MSKSATMYAELQSWKYILENKKDLAKDVISRLKRKLSNNPLNSDPHYYSTAISRVSQGFATPQDYGLEY